MENIISENQDDTIKRAAERARAIPYLPDDAEIQAKIADQLERARASLPSWKRLVDDAIAATTEIVGGTVDGLSPGVDARGRAEGNMRATEIARGEQELREALERAGELRLFDELSSRLAIANGKIIMGVVFPINVERGDWSAEAINGGWLGTTFAGIALEAGAVDAELAARRELAYRAHTLRSESEKAQTAARERERRAEELRKEQEAERAHNAPLFTLNATQQTVLAAAQLAPAGSPERAALVCLFRAHSGKGRVTNRRDLDAELDALVLDVAGASRRL